MNIQTIMTQLNAHKPVLAERFGVLELALFGSVIKDKAKAHKDVDILVSFDGPTTSTRYLGVRFYLEKLLGYPVDLVIDKSLRPEQWPVIKKEAIYV